MTGLHSRAHMKTGSLYQESNPGPLAYSPTASPLSPPLTIDIYSTLSKTQHILYAKIADKLKVQ